MKAILLTSVLALAAGMAHAEWEYFYAHNNQFTKGVAISYVVQGEDYEVSNNLSPTGGWIREMASSVYTMPADVEKQNLLFEVTPGYVIDNIQLEMSDNEFSDQADGGPDEDGFVLLTGIEIDGQLTAYHDTLWNGRNSSLPEEKPRFRRYLLRGIAASKTIRLHFDCSHSNRVLDPKPDQYTGETKAHGEVIVGMSLSYDLPSAQYERVSDQSQVVAGEKYMITANVGDRVVQLYSDTVTTAANNTYLIGKDIDIRPSDLKYEGKASIVFTLQADTTGFGYPGAFFLTLPRHYDSYYGLRTSGLSFYIDYEHGVPYYANYEWEFDPFTLENISTIVGLTYYRDLWEIVINDDQSVSFYSHNMDNQEGRELQYNDSKNYFIYQNQFTYLSPLYLWHQTGVTESIRDVRSTAASEAPAYNLAGQPASLRHAGLYVQGGRKILVK